jgi:hypothetical protein
MFSKVCKYKSEKLSKNIWKKKIFQTQNINHFKKYIMIESFKIIPKIFKKLMHSYDFLSVNVV